MRRNRKKIRQKRSTLWLLAMACSILTAIYIGSYYALLLPIFVMAVMHPWMKHEGGVAILTYHSVAPNADWLPWAKEISVTPEILDAQLTALRRAGCSIISTRNFLEARKNGAPLPKRPVILHFDDGYYDNFVHARPILITHNAAATFFASTRFIEPSPRSYEALDGYMTREELRDLHANPLFEVHPHGTDHGRVPVSDHQIDILNEDNWRQNAWMTWAAQEGSLHDWARKDAPAVPLGSPVFKSAPALAAVAVDETKDAHLERVRMTLQTARDQFAELVPQSPADIFCWPQNVTVQTSRAIAADIGYISTTGGKGCNRPDEPADVLSRVHMGDRNFGFRSKTLDGVIALATARAFHGNLYWSFLIFFASTVKKIVRKLS